jgi:hypothetical protein
MPVSRLLAILSKVPPEAFESLGRLVSHLLSGDTEAAEREARVTAETIAAKRLIDDAYEAGRKARG